jgi:hypothetical protein
VKIKLLLLICIIAQTCFAQMPPDSLIGIYDGKYYFKYNSDTIWTITPDSEYVTLIDTNNCSVKCYGDIGVFNTAGFETHYNYCYGNSPDGFVRFYGGDSLFIKFSNISQPPPNYKLYSVRFVGKRIPSSAWVGTNEVAFSNNITIFPNPFKDKILLKLPATVGNSRVTIYNMMGQNVFDKILNNSETSIDVGFLHKGVYSILIGAGGKRNFYKKIMKI